MPKMYLRSIWVSKLINYDITFNFVVPVTWIELDNSTGNRKSFFSEYPHHPHKEEAISIIDTQIINSNKISSNNNQFIKKKCYNTKRKLLTLIKPKTYLINLGKRQYRKIYIKISTHQMKRKVTCFFLFPSVHFIHSFNFWFWFEKA